MSRTTALGSVCPAAAVSRSTNSRICVATALPARSVLSGQGSSRPNTAYRLAVAMRPSSRKSRYSAAKVTTSDSSTGSAGSREGESWEPSV